MSEKICPMMTRWVTITRNDEMIPDLNYCYCQREKCQLWVDKGKIKRGNDAEEILGYCGLIRKGGE